MSKAVLTIFLLLTAAAAEFTPLLNGQSPRFHHYTGKDGLSQNTVFAIFQDRRGFLWLGAEEGLNRFDGYQFRVFQHQPDNPLSLSHNRIISIFQDRGGVLWVGSDGGGLNRFNPGAETFTRFVCRGDVPGGLSHDTIWCILEDRDGVLWVGTDDGLNRLNRETMDFTAWRPPNEERGKGGFGVRVMREDRDGMLWLGSRAHGLLIFDKAREMFYMVPPPEASGGRPFGAIISMIFTGDNQETLWIGCEHGLRRMDAAKRRYIPLPDKMAAIPALNDANIVKILADRRGVLWIGAFETGIFRCDLPRQRVDFFAHDPRNPDSLSHNNVFDILEDQSGVMWIGSAKGLNKLDKKQERFGYWEVKPDGAAGGESSVVWSICKDRRGVVWLGAETGILQLDRETGAFKPFLIPDAPGAANPSPTRRKTAWSILEDRRGDMWFGVSDLGLFHYRPLSGASELFRARTDVRDALGGDDVRIIYEDRAETLWVGTEAGLNRMDRENRRFFRYLGTKRENGDLFYPPINAIIEDQQRHLWIGAQTGLFRLTPQTGETLHWKKNTGPNANGLSHNSVSCLRIDRRGVLWIGSKGGGLNRMNPVSRQFTHYTVADGLPSNTIHAILEDNSGIFWITSNGGLSRFDPAASAITFANYDYGDGLQENEFNEGAFFRSNDGELFFGGINGFNAFYPDRVKNNLSPPHTVITALKIMDKDPGLGEHSPLKKAVSETRELFLSHRQSTIEFHFTGLDFSNPGKNRYEYRMEPFDTEWAKRDASTRFAKYTNLEPGEYAFRVRACNNDGVWDSQGAAIRIVIAPPFWKTWWFTILAVLGFAFASYFLIHFITRHIAMSEFWRREKYVGKYKLEEKIGGGGMGTIYRARDTMDNNKQVAIKILREELFGDETYEKRFKQEAAIIDQLEHPHIVRVLERGQHRQKLFIVMELLKGVTLAQKIEREYKIQLAEIVEIMQQIAQALIKIHGRNIVHRDLKPENIMLLEANGARNFVKLLDFGLALNRFQSRITQTGTVLGTVNYMSPEQISHGDFSFASDMYSLGVIFYEAATSQVPFPGDNVSEIMRKILKSAPLEPKQLRPDLPDDYNRLIMRLIEKEPEQRPNARETAELLKLFSQTAPPPTETKTTPDLDPPPRVPDTAQNLPASGA